MEDSREIGFISDEADDWCVVHLAYHWCLSQEGVKIKLPSLIFYLCTAWCTPAQHVVGVYLRIMQR